MSLEGAQAPDFTLESTAGGTVTLSETLATGPTVVLFNRGPWCSYCAEQLRTFSLRDDATWRRPRIDVLPVLGDPVPDLVEMRDRFDLRLQLLSDPDLSVAARYSGIEDNDRMGEIPVAGTYVVDTDGTVRYEQVAENPADRTYANYVLHFLRNDFERPYAEE